MSGMSSWLGGRRSTPTTRHPGMVLLCALGLVATLSAQGPPPRPPRPPGSNSTQSGDQVVSPVAMATWVARRASDGGRVLELLVLWRGTPAWFARGTGSGASGGGDGRRVNKTIRRGDLTLQLEFDSRTRLATIQGKPIELRDQNVVLVDGVDEAQGPRVVGTLRVDSTLPPGDGPARIEETMRRSPEIVFFLRCDTRLADPLMQKMAEMVCASVLGR